MPLPFDIPESFAWKFLFFLSAAMFGFNLVTEYWGGAIYNAILAVILFYLYERQKRKEDSESRESV